MNSPRTIRVLLLFVVVASIMSVGAQTVTESKTLFADKDNFSVNVPKGFVSHKEPTSVTVYFDGEGIHGSVKRDKANGLERLMWTRSQPIDKVSYQSSQFDEFTVVRAVSTQKTGGYWEQIYIGSQDRYYTVSASGKDSSDQKVRAVLDSIRLNGRFIFKHMKGTEPDPTQTQRIDLAELNTSREVVEALKRPDASEKIVRYEKLNTVNDSGDTDNASATVYTKSLRIVGRPKASYTGGARSKGIAGSVHGRVLFKADGTIGEIIMDPTLDKGLARKSAEAARQIKFLPAEIDGKPVDQWRPITYTFNIY